jgi:zinc protease
VNFGSDKSLPIAISSKLIYLCKDFTYTDQQKRNWFMKKLAGFIIILLVAANSWAADDAKLPEWSYEHSDLAPDPALVFGKLPNGFRYVLMENSNPKNRISMHLNIQAGSLYEKDDQQGLAHFLEHLAFDGSEHFAPGEMVKFFQKIGMQFGPDANAHTAFDETVYDVLLPDNTQKSIEEGLMVLKDYSHGLLLLPTEVDRERKVILAEKRTRDSVWYRTYLATVNFEFPESRIPKRMPIGDEKVLESADQKIIKDFYDTWYRPDKMVLIMVGDFDKKLAASLITEKFSNLTAKAPERKFEGLGEVSHQGIKPFYHFEKEAGNTEVGIEVIQKKAPDADSLAYQKQLLIKKIANRIVQDRLDTLLRKPDTPFTSASVGSSRFLKEIEYAEISAQGKPENWDKMLSIIEQQLRQAISYGFTEAELNRVKKDIAAGFDNAVKKAATRDSSDLARDLIHHINSDRVFQSPQQEKDLLSSFVQSLGVKEVHEAFKKSWSPDHRLIMVTGNVNLSGTEKKPEEQILSVFDKSKSVAVSKPEDDKVVVFPYLPEPQEKGKIVRRTELTDLGIVQIDFENGIRLNLKKTDFEANEVIASLSFGTGKSDEPENKPGLSELSESLINESGLGALNRDELERALAGKSTSVSFDVADDSFALDSKTITEELPLMFQLIYAHLKDPAFRQDAYALVMEKYRQKHLSLSQSVNGMMYLEGIRFLAGGDSRFGLQSYDNFKKLGIDDVRNWVSEPLKNQVTELSVVGDFDVEKVIELAAKYIGTLPRPSIKDKNTSRLPKFPSGKSLNLSVETQIPKGIVVVAYSTDDIWDISRTRRLNMLASVFSEQMRERIREKLGAAYSPMASNDPSKAYPGYGTFKAFISVNPEQAEMVAQEVKAISSDMIQKGISKDELQRAVDPMLTSIKDMRRKNSYWLSIVLRGSKEHPQQIEWSKTILNDVASITTDDILAMAKKYLDNETSATMIIKPKTANR